ncbi:MAG: CheR family methyltransferase [Planctomycetota bacterium]|jgi:chemotaxis protein methyltransferase CheR|nr:CheR family methyltransferase [Planctomycetota bacterium]MDP7251073.1 CheR family methyltransferase [Planctomycetota bacterium]
MNAVKLQLDEETHRLFAGFIETRAGLQFFDEAGYTNLRTAISRQMEEANSETPLEFYDFIRSQDGKEHLRAFIEELTNNETSFFRNLPQFEALIRHLLPELIRARESTRRLRIWSAGCASGEEPFSVVMALLEVLPFPENWKIEVVATDINSQVLWKARRGIFSGRTFKAMPQIYSQKFISQRDDGQYEVSPFVRQYVDFRMANLMEDLTPFNGSCDLIFCRNVMIYFRKSAIEKVLSKFRRTLAPDGYLLVGHAENPNNYSDDFSPLQVRDAFVYVPTKENFTSIPDSRPEPVADSDTPLIGGSLPPVRPRIFRTDEKEEALKQFISTARHAFQHDRLHEAEELLETLFEEDRIPAPAHVLMACLLVTTNRQEQAALHVKTALEEDQFCAEAHYLQGLFELDRNDTEQAMQCFKRSIFSDNQFPLSYFQLARLFHDKGEYRMAVTKYQNALKALDGPSKVLWSDLFTGLSPELVRQACHSAIELCRSRG